MAALDDEPVVDPFGGVALLVRPPRFDSSTGSTHTSCPARAGLDLGAGVGAAGDMSSMSAYFATVLQLTQSLLAISARGTPPASIDRISFIMSWGTVISSTLPGRARQSLRPGIQYGEGRAPWAQGARPSCSFCSILNDHGAQKRRPFGPLLWHLLPSERPPINRS